MSGHESVAGRIPQDLSYPQRDDAGRRDAPLCQDFRRLSFLRFHVASAALLVGMASAPSSTRVNERPAVAALAPSRDLSTGRSLCGDRLDRAGSIGGDAATGRMQPEAASSGRCRQAAPTSVTCANKQLGLPQSSLPLSPRGFPSHSVAAVMPLRRRLEPRSTTTSVEAGLASVVLSATECQ